MWRDAGSIEAWVAQEEVRLRAVAGKVKTAQEEQGREHWWEVDVGALDEAELPEFATALDVLRSSAASTSWPKLRSHSGSSCGTSPHTFVPSHHQVIASVA